MSAEDFAKPENAAALEKTLESCKLVLGADARAANCKAAHNAKFALGAAEIGRARRAQIREQEEMHGVTTVTKSAPPTTASIRPQQPAQSGQVVERETPVRQ